MAIADETLDLAQRLPPAVEAVRRERRHHVGLVRVVPRRVPGWEWGLAVVALFLLARSPMFFYRQRIADVLDGRVFFIWQDDGPLRVATAAVLLTLYVVAARRCDPRNLLRQPYLLAFMALVLASTAWSAEPTVTLWRSLFFLGTAVVGWYIGERYSLREQIGIVGAMAALGAVASAVALVTWPEVTQRMPRLDGVWTGAYANRNWLGLVMSFGLLTLPFLWKILPRRRRLLLLFLAGGEVFLLIKTGSRTGPVALATAAIVGLGILGARRLGIGPLGPAAGAATVAMAAGYLFLVVHWNFSAILDWLGRERGLNGRIDLWHLDILLAAERPWVGWGFEAVWAHPPAIARTIDLFGRYPYAAHNGYYEILLSVGSAGLIVFLLFLVVAGWRAFHVAWEGRSVLSLWPIVLLVFVAVANFSESLFVSAESTWALTVAAAVAATRGGRRRRAIS